jgi:hypothetical protein
MDLQKRWPKCRVSNSLVSSTASVLASSGRQRGRAQAARSSDRDTGRIAAVERSSALKASSSGTKSPLQLSDTRAQPNGY